MTKEEVYQIYGIDNDTLLNYEDIVNAYIENIMQEICYENLDCTNIEKIVDGFSFLYKLFYPEYTEEKSIKDAVTIYQENLECMRKMIDHTAVLLLRINDDASISKNFNLIIKIEKILQKDYYARVEEPNFKKILN